MKRSGRPCRKSPWINMRQRRARAATVNRKTTNPRRARSIWLRIPEETCRKTRPIPGPCERHRENRAASMPKRSKPLPSRQHHLDQHDIRGTWARGRRSGSFPSRGAAPGCFIDIGGASGRRRRKSKESPIPAAPKIQNTGRQPKWLATKPAKVPPAMTPALIPIKRVVMPRARVEGSWWAPRRAMASG